MVKSIVVKLRHTILLWLKFVLLKNKRSYNSSCIMINFKIDYETGQIGGKGPYNIISCLKYQNNILLTRHHTTHHIVKNTKIIFCPPNIIEDIKLLNILKVCLVLCCYVQCLSFADQMDHMWLIFYEECYFDTAFVKQILHKYCLYILFAFFIRKKDEKLQKCPCVSIVYEKMCRNIISLFFIDEQLTWLENL
jgi:hypothetical protein